MTPSYLFKRSRSFFFQKQVNTKSWKNIKQFKIWFINSIRKFVFYFCSYSLASFNYMIRLLKNHSGPKHYMEIFAPPLLGPVCVKRDLALSGRDENVPNLYKHKNVFVKKWLCAYHPVYGPVSFFILSRVSYKLTHNFIKVKKEKIARSSKMKFLQE